MWIFVLGVAHASMASVCTPEDRRLWSERNVQVNGTGYSQPCARCIVDAHFCHQSCAKFDGEVEKVCEICVAEKCQPVFELCMGPQSFRFEVFNQAPQRALQMPILSSIPETVRGGPATPVVFMHGLGDSGSNAGMQSICNSVTEAYAGTYVNCLNVANGMASLDTVMDSQLAEFVQAVRADPKLQNGFNAVGLSQGGVLVRSYIERYNDPPVHTFISMVGPQNGVAECPDNVLYRLICGMWKKGPYWEPFSFSDYWKDPTDKEKYLANNRFLADINNERDAKNATYTEHMKSLKNYVLVEALQDSIVQPHVSEQHGFDAWGSSSKIEDLEATEAFKGDWIGLKTLKDSGRLHKFTYNGNHMRWSKGFWMNTILPFLKPDSREQELIV